MKEEKSGGKLKLPRSLDGIIEEELIIKNQ